MARVLVLNATYEPINVCTLRRAAVLLLKQKAELLERREGAIVIEPLHTVNHQAFKPTLQGQVFPGRTSIKRVSYGRFAIHVKSGF